MHSSSVPWIRFSFRAFVFCPLYRTNVRTQDTNPQARHSEPWPSVAAWRLWYGSLLSCVLGKMHVLLEQIAPSSLRVDMCAVVFCFGYRDTRIQRAIRAKRAAVSSPKTKVPTVLRVFSDGECGPLRTGIWADACIKKNEAHDIVSDHFLRITDGSSPPSSK